MRYASRPHASPTEYLQGDWYDAVGLRDLVDDYYIHIKVPFIELHPRSDGPAKMAISEGRLYVAAGTSFSMHRRNERRNSWTCTGRETTDAVTALHASPLGLVAGFANHSVAVYDDKMRTFGRQMKGHRGAVTAVARLGDDVLVSGSADKTVRIRRASTRRGLGVLRGHDGAVRWVAAGCAGTMLSHGGGDGRVKMWDVERMTCVSTGRVGGCVVEALVGGADGARDTVYVAWGRCVNVLDTRMGLHQTAAVLSLPRGARWAAAGGLRALAGGAGGRVAAAVGGGGVCVWEGRGGWEGVGLGWPGRWAERAGYGLRAVMVGGRAVVAGGGAKEVLAMAVDGAYDGVVVEDGVRSGVVEGILGVGEEGLLVGRGDGRVEWADVRAAEPAWDAARQVRHGDGGRRFWSAGW